MNEEKKYFDSLIGKNYTFANVCSYKFPDKAILNLTLHSNLDLNSLVGEKIIPFSTK